MLTGKLRVGWVNEPNLRFGRDFGISDIKFGIFHSASNKFLAFGVIGYACSVALEFRKTFYQNVPFNALL